MLQILRNNGGKLETDHRQVGRDLEESSRKNSEGLRCQFCIVLIPTLLYTIHDSFCNKSPDKFMKNFTTDNSDKRKYIKGQYEIINKELQEI